MDHGGWRSATGCVTPGALRRKRFGDGAREAYCFVRPVDKVMFVWITPSIEVWSRLVTETHVTWKLLRGQK